jgi:hypothetical protein
VGDTELANEIRRVVESADITDAALSAAVRVLVAKERDDRRYRLAHEMRIVRSPGQPHAELWIDGEPFPWYTSDGYHVDFQRGDIPNVTLTIRAETLFVEDELLKPKEPKAEDG